MAKIDKKKQLIEKLIDRARIEGWLLHPVLSDRDRKRRLADTYPGERILDLSKEERELLKTLKVEDFNHRIDVAAFPYVCPGANGERRGRLGKHLKEQQDKYEKEQLKKEEKQRYK